MNEIEKQHLIDQWLVYIEANALPAPLPTSREEYEVWSGKADGPAEIDEVVEEAWDELYRLVDEQPVIAWELLCAIAAKCRTDDAASLLAAGPLENFVQKYGREFRQQIDAELAQNEGLRRTFGWLRV